MIVQVRAGGLDDNFSYAAGDDVTRDGFVVDPCGDTEVLLAAVRQHGITVRYIFNTHGHRDHTEGNAALQRATGAPVCIHPADAGGRHDVQLLDGGVTFTFGQTCLTVIHTPGHTPGSVCLRFADGLFTGDTLFVGYCGFAPDAAALYRSLQHLRTLPDDLIVYSGHEYGTTPTATLGQEKMHNPYLQEQDEATFCARLRELR